MIIWITIFIIYLLWDGWVWEWRECGYAGPNQHFDWDLTDMVYEVVDGEIVYSSTNNWFNILYLCFFTLLMGWTGLLFDNKYLKQGCMATLAFPVIAAMSTLTPWNHHLYFLQIVYDIVHLSGIIVGVYLFSQEKLKLKLALPAIFATWGVYLLSRILCTPWPYWDYDGLAFYSVNQANDMPFYFYGLEYGVVVVIFLVINWLFEKVGNKMDNGKLRAFFPFIIFTILCIVFLVTGIIQVPNISTGTCP